MPHIFHIIGIGYQNPTSDRVISTDWLIQDLVRPMSGHIISSYPRIQILLSHLLVVGGTGEMDTGTFLAIVIAVPLAGVILIVAIILLVVPKTRRALFPYRDREHHQPSSKKEAVY